MPVKATRLRQQDIIYIFLEPHRESFVVVRTSVFDYLLGPTTE